MISIVKLLQLLKHGKIKTNGKKKDEKNLPKLQS